MSFCLNSIAPPDSGFQMILMRNNVLTYYKDERKIPVLKKVLDGLMPSGVLVIGDGEKMPSSVEGLIPYNHHSCIFQKAA